MKTNLIIDGNNILHRTFHANNRHGDPEEVIISMCILTALYKMNEFYRKYEPDDVIVTFDSYSWRKEYTKDLSKCVTNKKYKGHRRTNKSAREMRLFAMLDEHIQDFAEMLKGRTRVVVLQKEYLEGDDLMAAWVQMHRSDDNVVISGDGDMVQLLRYDGVKVVDPANGKEKSLADWDGDADLFLFEKCFRGEQKTNDNIQNAYPRLRREKIVRAYTDEYLRTELMAHTFKQLDEMPNGDIEENEYTTGEIIKENMLLMSLRHQPKAIKVLMVTAVEEGIESRGRYNHLKFLKYCDVNDLQAIINKIEDFVPMLAVR